MSNRKEKLISYINQNPNLSGNKIYEYSRKHDFGIRKQDFYALYRQEKSLKEPSKEKQLKAIPTKYKTQKIKKEIRQIEQKKKRIKKEIKPKKVKLYTGIRYPKRDGSYGIIEAIDLDGSKWIKFRDKEHLIKQLEKLLDADSLQKKYDLIFHGFGKYQEYNEQEYVSLLTF